MTKLEEYYNKFNEDKRLTSRHGQVEFEVTCHFIDEAISGVINNIYGNMPNDIPLNAIRIADIGAGTGRYSLTYAKAGYNVTAVELVNYNLGILKKHAREENLNIECLKGDARKLKRLPDDQYDVTLLLGPMYHLHTDEDKVKALKEAMRITKKGGMILVAYVMSDYAIVRHGFMDHNISKSVSEGALTDDFRIKSDENELYDYVRIDDIDRINALAGINRYKIIAPDGPADYIRGYLNEMDETSFRLFIDYQKKNAHRLELIGASSHTLDILVK